jgi:heat-inducible transcriptional repressor
MFLSPRQLQIMQAVVKFYIESGVPVGSRTITKHFNLGVSPATVRNEMADLEEMGLLIQPHVSAGRIPSDLGYRVYVNSLNTKQKPDIESVSRFETEIEQRIVEKEQLLINIAETLSQLTSYATIVSGPYIKACRLKEFALIPVSEKDVIALVVTDNGLTTNKTLHLPNEILAEDIGYINRVLNARLKGRCLNDIKSSEIRQLVSMISEHINNEDLSLMSLVKQVVDVHKTPIVADGIINVLSQPEFKTENKYLQLVEALNAQDILAELLSSENMSTLNISIGKEITNVKMQECSIIKVPYLINDHIAGVIGVLGPKRMTYARVISLLEYVSRRIEDILQD